MLLILVHNLDIRFIPDERGATLFITRIKYTELLMNIHEYKRRVHEWLIFERYVWFALDVSSVEDFTM